MCYRILSLLFILLWVNSVKMKANVADTLSVDVEESDWEEGLNIVIQPDSSITSVKSSDIHNSEIVTIYNMYGYIVLQNVLWTDALKELPKGIYIVNRKKRFVR